MTFLVTFFVNCVKQNWYKEMLPKRKASKEHIVVYLSPNIALSSSCANLTATANEKFLNVVLNYGIAKGT